MKRLLLLRHAKSSWSERGLADHDRPLAGRGQRAAPAIGQVIAELGLIPERVLCSTALRARQTLELAAAEWPGPLDILYQAGLYHASTDALLKLTRSDGGLAASLMLVGHQPGLQDFALELIGTAERAARARLQAKFPTAALAVIDFDLSEWRDLRSGTGRLVRYLRPRDLER